MTDDVTTYETQRRQFNAWVCCFGTKTAVRMLTIERKHNRCGTAMGQIPSSTERISS